MIQKKIELNDDLFSDMVIQIGILKEIYDKIAINSQMSVFQKKVMLRNKQQNIDVLKKIEKICE